MTITTDKTKAKAREALLEMARAWEKEPGKIQHAIGAYEEVIGSDIESTRNKEQVRRFIKWTLILVTIGIIFGVIFLFFMMSLLRSPML